MYLLSPKSFVIEPTSFTVTARLPWQDLLPMQSSVDTPTFYSSDDTEPQSLTSEWLQGHPLESPKHFLPSS